MNKTNIAWTDYTWNPITGCSPISEGCANCYAAAINKRFHLPQTIQFHPERLEEPLKKKKPSMIFAWSMTDLFHPDVSFEWLLQLMGIMILSPWHTYQVLTKRPDRMLQFFDRWPDGWWAKKTLENTIFSEEFYAINSVKEFATTKQRLKANDYYLEHYDQSGRGKLDGPVPYPIPNLWLGVTVENSKHLDRVEQLLAIPAAVRFVSLEPLLEDIDIVRHLSPTAKIWRCKKCGWTGHRDLLGGGCLSISCPGKKCIASNGIVASNNDELEIAEHEPHLDWVIVGAETGPGRRECKIEWVRAIVEQCQDAGVPCFVKQIEMNGKISHDMNEWPADLRVRQWPERSR